MLTISKKQKEVISKLKDGYVLKYLLPSGEGWVLTKKTKDGVKSIGGYRIACRKLFHARLIRFKNNDRQGNNIYGLTKIGKSI